MGGWKLSDKSNVFCRRPEAMLFKKLVKEKNAISLSMELIILVHYINSMENSDINAT